MTRELLVLRHGKSDWTGRTPDFDRPLAARGRKAARRIGHWLREGDLLPDRVLSSPALRARQSAERVCLAAGLESVRIDHEPAIYEASLDTLLEVLAAIPPRAARALIVGHNPGFEELVRHLGAGSLAKWEAGNLMPTAALARLAMPASWEVLARGSATCLSLTRPRELD